MNRPAIIYSCGGLGLRNCRLMYYCLAAKDPPNPTVALVKPPQLLVQVQNSRPSARIAMPSSSAGCALNRTATAPTEYRLRLSTDTEF